MIFTFLHLEFCSQVSIFCALSFFNLQTNLVTNNFVMHCQKSLFMSDEKGTNLVDAQFETVGLK